MLESFSSEELQFIKAIEKYKKDSGKIFLSWSEVLKIVKDLGYHKVARKGAGTGAGAKGRSEKRRKSRTRCEPA